MVNGEFGKFVKKWGVIPAKAGISRPRALTGSAETPAFAGVTE
jgi:hypothetical protein